MYKVGDSLEVKVVKVLDYGVFVIDEDGTKGLIHVSQVSDHYVNNLNDYFTAGDLIEVSIMEYDETKNQLKLSYKELNKVDYIKRNFENHYEFDVLAEHRDKTMNENKKRLGIYD
jgi:predicted RNA-binding protein with RPS1 domain